MSLDYSRILCVLTQLLFTDFHMLYIVFCCIIFCFVAQLDLADTHSLSWMKWGFVRCLFIFTFVFVKWYIHVICHKNPSPFLLGFICVLQIQIVQRLDLGQWRVVSPTRSRGMRRHQYHDVSSHGSGTDICCCCCGTWLSINWIIYSFFYRISRSNTTCMLHARTFTIMVLFLSLFFIVSFFLFIFFLFCFFLKNPPSGVKIRTRVPHRGCRRH